MTTAYVCIGLLGLPIFVLGFAVSIFRDRENAILIYVAALLNPASWVVWMMWIATGGRYLIATGLIVGPTLDKPHPLRFVGALATYVAGTALAIAVLLGG